MISDYLRSLETTAEMVDRWLRGYCAALQVPECWVRLLFPALAGILLVPALAVAGQLTLTWTDNADTEDGFRIERCKATTQGGTCTNFGQIQNVGVSQGQGNQVAWTNTGLTVGNTYCYRVRAFNAAGASVFTNSACGTVPAVTAVPTEPQDLVVQ